MPIRTVIQENIDGCFIACVAMLMDISYAKAFSILHPNKSLLEFSHGFSTYDISDTASLLLTNIGFKVRSCRYKRFNSIKNRISQHAIIIIRWKCSPTLCHCILYDSDTKSFIDPSHGNHIINLNYLHNQIDNVLVIEKNPGESNGT